MEPVSPVLLRCPLELPETVFAKNQPEYLPLPAVVTRDGCVTSRWRLTWRERLRVLWTGDLWLQQFAFGHALQPQRPSVTEPQFELSLTPAA
jgi:hypothetical protein